MNDSMHVKQAEAENESSGKFRMLLSWIFASSL